MSTLLQNNQISTSGGGAQKSYFSKLPRWFHLHGWLLLKKNILLCEVNEIEVNLLQQLCYLNQYVKEKNWKLFSDCFLSEEHG